MACVGTSIEVKSVQVTSSDVTHTLKDPRLYLVLRCNWSEYEGKAWERGYCPPPLNIWYQCQNCHCMCLYTYCLYSLVPRRWGEERLACAAQHSGKSGYFTGTSVQRRSLGTRLAVCNSVINLQTLGSHFELRAQHVSSTCSRRHRLRL